MSPKRPIKPGASTTSPKHLSSVPMSAPAPAQAATECRSGRCRQSLWRPASSIILFPTCGFRDRRYSGRHPYHPCHHPCTDRALFPSAQSVVPTTGAKCSFRHSRTRDAKALCRSPGRRDDIAGYRFGKPFPGPIEQRPQTFRTPRRASGRYAPVARQTH